jgi:hypothetical protein
MPTGYNISRTKGTLCHQGIRNHVSASSVCILPTTWILELGRPGGLLARQSQLLNEPCTFRSLSSVCRTENVKDEWFSGSRSCFYLCGFGTKHILNNTLPHHAKQPDHSNPRPHDSEYGPIEGPKEERTAGISVSQGALRVGTCKSSSTAQTHHQSQIGRIQDSRHTRDIYREQQVLSLSLTRISSVDLISVHKLEKQQSMRLVARQPGV